MDISKILAGWYDLNKRDLPWRHSSNPYNIWISEIILQQTRVAQGTSYYLRFTDRFPDVKSLASANTDDVIRLWQGLGYYTRAKNLQLAAKEIMKKHQGFFPTIYNDIINLPGIGDYTAAAIASFAFNYPAAAIDGNVTRVISRLYSVGGKKNAAATKKRIAELAMAILDKHKPGQHNQALIELGALICTPSNPKCNDCPLKYHCQAFLSNTVNDFPETYRKKEPRHRYFYYFLFQYEDKIIIQKRTAKDIWNSLYELPLYESSKPVTHEDLLNFPIIHWDFKPENLIFNSISSNIKHVLSHQVIHAVFVNINCKKLPSKNDWIPVHKDDLQKYAFPVLVADYLGDAAFDSAQAAAF